MASLPPLGTSNVESRPGYGPLLFPAGLLQKDIRQFSITRKYERSRALAPHYSLVTLDF